MSREVARGDGPLTGLRVLDLSRVLSGPHCGRMLADLGADVIKVEPPEGDLTRFSFPRVGSLATYFVQQNCGKRNVSLDLHRREGVALFRRLAATADVLVENFRPGVMDRLGLGHTVLAAQNPRLVYASITGFGGTGPWAQRRAYAVVVQAEAGMTHATAEAHGGRPRNDPHSHGDVYTALECLAGILAALYQRERTGLGQRVEVSMAETLLSVNEHAHHPLSGIDVVDEVPSFAPGDYPVLPTGEGHLVTVSGHPASRGTFERYCTVMGRRDLLDDPRLQTVAGRREHLDVVVDALCEFTSSFDDLDLLVEAFAAEDLALGVVRSVAEVAETEWARERGVIVDVDDRHGGTVRIPDSPIRFSAADSGVRGRPAYRGEHNREVFAEVGVGAAELERLLADGVLSARRPRSLAD
ncbi:MAG: CoA transferase [Acidimicrobiales bacterium]|nr:CoA transferase [Acidimicrobiales bacterium]